MDRLHEQTSTAESGMLIPEEKERPSDIKLLTAKDIQGIFHIGINQAYGLMQSEAFPSIRLNRRLYVEEGKLKEWLNTYAGRSYVF